MNTAVPQIHPLIPEEIIVNEILKRLPVKTLFRFKAVSKLWLSIISSRPFIDSHFQHSKLNPTRLFVFYNKHTTTPIFFSTNYPHTSSYNWPDTYYRWCSISPRGLICFYNDCGDTTIEIWNPSTGEHIEVNPPTREMRKRRPLFLGFDPVSKKHKLLSSSNGKNYVFTLGENSWRKMDYSSSNLITPILRGNCCIDGILYYLALTDQNDDNVLVLVRFDVGSERFLEPISLPEELFRVPDYYCSTLRIYVYGDRVLLLNLDYMRTYEYEMWVLENDHQWSPKRLIPRLPPSSEHYNVYSIDFIDGEELISSELIYSEFRLCSYDLEKGSSRWTKTRFPELKNKLDGSARYEVGVYYYVKTLESLKPLSVQQEEEDNI